MDRTYWSKYSNRWASVDTGVIAKETRVVEVIDYVKRDRELCNMYQDGATIKQCGKHFKLSCGRVSQILRKYDIERRSRGPQAGMIYDLEDALVMDAVYVGAGTESELPEFERALKFPGTIRAFARLDEESQSAVRKQFQRHRTACQHVGVDIDPLFLSEAIYEAKREQQRRSAAA
jgi:hypothetical protein